MRAIEEMPDRWNKITSVQTCGAASSGHRARQPTASTARAGLFRWPADPVDLVGLPLLLGVPTNGSAQMDAETAGTTDTHIAELDGR